MKKNIYYFIVLIGCLCSSCSKNDFKIKGEIAGFSDSTKVFIYNYVTEFTDSTMLINNKFEIRCKSTIDPEKVIVSFNEKWSNERIFLLIHNENISLNGNKKYFPFVNFKGSKMLDDYIVFQKLTYNLEAILDSLNKSWSNSTTEAEQIRIDKEADLIEKRINSLQMEYILENSDSYPAIICLCDKMYYLPKDKLLSMYSKFNLNLKNCRYGKMISTLINSKIPKIGDNYVDFVANDKNGKEIKFSSVKGRFILLDFTWAECGACKMSLPELKEVYKKYNRDITIISFSNDRNKEIWHNSLKRDNIDWLSLSNGRGYFDEVPANYGVNAYPTFFLLDSNKKVIDKWVGYTIGQREIIGRIEKLLEK